jgi:hypothetical protein
MIADVVIERIERMLRSASPDHSISTFLLESKYLIRIRYGFFPKCFDALHFV